MCSISVSVCTLFRLVSSGGSGAPFASSTMSAIGAVNGVTADVSHKLEYLENEFRQEQSNNHMVEEKYMQVRHDLERLSSEESVLRQVGKLILNDI